MLPALSPAPPKAPDRGVPVGAAEAIAYSLTKTGAKYHRATCSSLRASKIPVTLKEAAAQYAPCRICRPPVPGASATPSRGPSAPRLTAPEGSASPAPVTSLHCQAITKKGTQCSRLAKAGSRYCWQHGG